MLDWNDCPAVERVPGKGGGEWLFKGTRVPVRALFENLEDGARIDDFLEWFPGVTRAQAELVLRHAEERGQFLWLAGKPFGRELI
jgi:uncharacterized protein (DUF433 family)